MDSPDAKKTKRCNCRLLPDYADDCVNLKPFGSKKGKQPEGVACDLDEMVADYNAKYLVITNNYLKSLNKITDFICGALNEKEAPGAVCFCKKDLQYCLKTSTLKKTFCLFKANTIALSECRDFVSDYRPVREMTDGELCKGFGSLVTFDFSQRYCHNRGIMLERIHISMPKLQIA